MSRYIQKRFLGSGTYSQVFEGHDTITNQRVALKRITLCSNEGMPSTAMREISILKSLEHENVLKLYTVVHGEKTLTLVFEYIDYDLKDYFTIYGRVNLLEIIKQLLEGVAYIHENMIIHRDLKPQNILVTSNGILKIADFGLARNLNIDMPSYSSEVITLWYRSPELLVGCTTYSFYIDMWSIGCIITESITGTPLFPGKDKVDQLSIILRETQRSKKDFLNFIISKVGNIPEFLVRIILGCLEVDVDQRMTALDVLFILKKIGKVL